MVFHLWCFTSGDHGGGVQSTGSRAYLYEIWNLDMNYLKPEAVNSFHKCLKNLNTGSKIFLIFPNTLFRSMSDLGLNFYLIEVYLIYNIVLVSGMYSRVIQFYMYFFQIIFHYKVITRY